MFNGKWYLQIKGVAMGTKATVNLAILTIGYLEIKLYTTFPNYFLTVYSRYIYEQWKRFIDDCFMPWKKGENLELFEKIITSLPPLIKFIRNTGDSNISRPNDNSNRQRIH